MRWSLVARSILLAPALAVIASSAADAQGAGVVTGTVVDSVTGTAIANAQVVVVGTQLGTITDNAGSFSIRSVPAGSATLRAQRIGYAPQDRTVFVPSGSSVSVAFALRAVSRMLSEVVVTGYGTSMRANVSSSIATVSADEIANTPVAGVDAALQGKAPGIQVVQNAGNPGNGITVRIRGSASISAGNQPLYVIDGIPMLRDDYSQMGIGGQDLTAVTGINPDEIESIDILKDAAAAAIYGSRGSNGVVMITTKRGRAGASRVTFSAYSGSQSVPKGNRWDMLNAREYVEYMNEAAENDDYGSNYFGDPNDVVVSTDWQSEVFRSAPINNVSLGMNGGTDRIRYYLSGSYYDQEGVVIGSAYKRASGRVNLDFTASSRLSIRSSLGVNREEHNRIDGDNTIHGVVTNSIALQPNLPARHADGTFTSTDDGLEYTNPIAIGSHDINESRSLRALGNVEAAYALLPSLTLNGRVGMDVLNLRDLYWGSPKIIGSYAQSQAAGVASMGNSTANRYVLESFLTFDRPTGVATALSLTGGASIEWNGEETEWVSGEGFSNEEFQYVGNAATVVSYDGDWTGHNLTSFFARANAVMLDRYLLTASLRVDGSSRFGSNNRYGVFPAASLGWNITEEPFAGALANVADFKLRASFGRTGNQDIADFAPLARFGKASYSDVPGIAQESFGNPDLRWETTREFDIGFDLALLAGRLNVVGDAYSKVTDDLLLSRPITSTSGQTSVFENVGNMENRGFELGIATVNVEPSSADGFRWSTNFNISWNRNEVTKLFNDEPFPVGLYSVSRVEVGEPLSAFYTLRFLGVDPATGDAIFDDINGDGTINSADRVIIGSPHPNYWGGLTNELSWRGFDLRSFFQFAQGHMIFNAISVFANDGGYYHDNKFRKVLRRWQGPGDITDEPRASYDGISGADRISSRYFEDGSYIRFGELTLGYRLPPQLLGGMNMNDARIYISGRNLHTWTDYSGYSPDVNSNGSSSNTALATEFYAYPIARTFMVGISGSW